jgi:hypothetical protein
LKQTDDGLNVIDDFVDKIELLFLLLVGVVGYSLFDEDNEQFNKDESLLLFLLLLSLNFRLMFNI